MKKPAQTKFTVDYRRRTTMPIRDMAKDGKIVFLVDVYGWTANDVCMIPGGSEPMRKAVERMGLDPERFQAMIWDADVGNTSQRSFATDVRRR